MSSFFDKVEIKTPIDPRAAFHDGRTNATTMYYTVNKNTDSQPMEHIKYTDICSLYPTVNKYRKYPLEHLKIITKNFDVINDQNQPYEGLIKCKILPPRMLYHPVLPHHHGHKLYFPLCRTCTETHRKECCQHNNAERAFEVIWVSLELYKALDLGYIVLETYEVWHYDETEQHDHDNNPDRGLFTSYINDFMKLKQEADGWPSWVKSESDKSRYISEYYDQEGIQLEPGKIQKNPGMRALAKLMLNAFWEKFGQRINMVKKTAFYGP